MKLSILIPLYGQPDLARAAVLSAARYLGVVHEIRVIDDMPEDPLVNHYPEVLLVSDRIKYEINAVNLGRTGTYNRLLQTCTTDLFLMLDGDDYLAESVDFVGLISLFEADSELAIACGRCCEVFGEEVIKSSGPTLRGDVPGVEYFKAWIGVDDLFPHSACIVKRSVAVSCLGYPSGLLNSDIAMLRSVLLDGNAIAVDELVSYWRFHGRNASRVTNTDVLLDNFGSIEIPYRRGVSRNLSIKGWLIDNTRAYLVSAFHQIVGGGGGLGRYLLFSYGLMRMLILRNPVALLGVLASIPKILALVLLCQMLGHGRFGRMMARRGNYVYISSDLR